MNGVQGVEGSNPFIPTRKQKPQGIYGNVGPFSVFERLRIRPCFRPEGRQVGKACPGGYGRAYELRLALRAISSGSGVRLCLSLSLVRHEGCGQQAAAGRCGTLHADLYPMKRRDQLLSAWSVRGVPLQGGGMETSGRQPCHFLHRRAEIAILKKCDVFIDKPAVFVYLHLRVGM